MKYNTKIINLVGGPGAGKSSVALSLAGKMKMSGMSADYVREFVKNWAYEGRKVQSHEQLEIFHGQSSSERPLYGNVEYAVSDSPLCLSEIYEKHYFGTDLTRGLYYEWMKIFKDVTPIFFKIERSKAYVQEGRYETESQAKEMDVKIHDKISGMCEMIGWKYYTVNYDTAVDEILQILGLTIKEKLQPLPLDPCLFLELGEEV